MKKVVAVFLCLVSVCCVFCFAFFSKNKNEKIEGYLRIHIRANSNEEIDQNVKYKVKESVVEYLTQKVQNCNDANEAMSIVNCELENIGQIATNTLNTNGFDYGAKAKLTEEFFPTRKYDSLVLENGFYDALILELGSGTGDNWWCVVYPPLCFGSEEKVVRSIIYDLINNK